MKTILKRTTLLCLLILATVCLSLIAACGGDKGTTDTDTTVTYTVTVLDDNDDPVKDVRLSFNKGSAFYTATTDADGKAAIELAADTYAVTLNNIPDGYSAPENISVSKDNPTVTVNLVKDFSYVVNLVDEDGNPFYHENVTIAICQIDGSCLTPSPLGTDGKWSMTNVDPGDYKVLITLPEDIKDKYTFEGNTATSHYYTGEHFSETKTEMTIVIKEVAVEKTEYAITVVNSDNEPVKNVYVNLSASTTFFTPVQTDDNGIAKIEVPSYGEYAVTVNAPEGYTFDNGAYKTTTSKHELTVTIHALNALEFTTEMTADEIEAYGNGFTMFRFNEDPAYSFKNNFSANETKYFTFTAHKTGAYVIFCKQANTVFTVSISAGAQDYTNGEKYTVETTVAQRLDVNSGNNVYFSVTAAAAGEIEFVIAAPDATPDSTTLNLTAAGKHEITVVSAAKYATVYFQPSQTGVYEISSEGDYDTRVEYYGNAITMFKTGDDDDSGEGNNFKLGGLEFAEAGSTGPTVAFRIFVKDGATFPATFNISIVRTGDAQETVTRNTVKVTPEELGNSTFSASGAFTAIDLSISHVFVKGDDGFYHLNSADGPVLVVKLASSFRNNFGLLSTEYGSGFYMYFADTESETINWDYLDFFDAYTEKCNADGVYGVNDEIKLMLQRWANYYINEYTLGISSLGTIANGNEWLIPCGYYYVSTLVGEGSATSPYRLDYGSYEIEIPTDGQVYFAMQYGEFTVNVVCGAAITINDPYRMLDIKETDTGYSFNCSSSRLQLVQFNVTNSGSAAVTINVNVTEQVKEANGNELVLGENTVEISAENSVDGQLFTFTPDEDGRYVISSASDDSVIVAGDDTIFIGDPDNYIYEITNGFAITIDAIAGETYSVLLGSMSMSGATYIVNVSKELDIGETQIVANVDGTVFGFSPMNEGKYLIYAVDEDENCSILYNPNFNGYNGDNKDGWFAFIIDCEAWKDYYFEFAAVPSFNVKDTATYNIVIVKLEDASLSVGDNTVTGTYNGSVYAFTADEDGTYTITSTDVNAGLMPGFDCQDCDIGGAVDITIDAQAGETYFFLFSISYDCWDEEATYTVTVTKQAE